jgi:chorismate mutase
MLNDISISESFCMSNEIAHSVAQTEGAAPESFLQRYRMHLIGSVTFLLIIVFLLIGIAVGMTKRNFEKKFYLEQIVKLKLALSQTLEARDDLGKEVARLKVELRAKSDRVDEVEAQLEKAENQKTKPAASAEPAEQASSGDQGVDYVRLKAGDCVVEGSSAATAAQWRECLKNARKTPESKH